MKVDAYQFRGFQSSDYPAEAALWTRLDPGRTFSADEIRRNDETFFKPPMVLFQIVAEERSSGRAVGIGSLRSDPESFDPQTFWADVDVDPVHQGQGLGVALANAVNAEAERRRARRLWAQIRVDDARAVRFLARQGFTEQRRSWRSRLEIARAATLPDRSDAFRREGISFLTLAEENVADPAVLRDLYEVYEATTADEPRVGPFTPIAIEQFVEEELRGPYFLPDAYFLARDGDRFVAVSILRRAEGEADTLHQAFTGTRREYRGRGIATELKRRAVEYARLHGYRVIRTGNDSLNHPMLAINRKLGFKPESERIVAEKRLGS